MAGRKRYLARLIITVGVAAALTAPVGTPLGDDGVPTAAAVEGTDRPAVEEVLVTGDPVASQDADWGTDSTGARYEQVVGRVTTHGTTGYDKQGFLQAQGGQRATTYLRSVTPRDSRIDAEAYFEWLDGVGSGVRFSVISRGGAHGYYNATIHSNPTTGTATLSINRVQADGTTIELASTAVAEELVAVNSKFRIQLEVEGSSPALRARIFPAGSAAPQWQLTATDGRPDHLTEGGRTGFSVYTSGTTPVANARVWNFRITRDTSSAAQASGIGAPELGSVEYPVPADAGKIVWVDPAAPATADDWDEADYRFDAEQRNVCLVANRRPRDTLPENRTVRTLAAAMVHAKDGDTIIMRGGTYHEQLRWCNGKGVTIQPENGAKVWLDGSRVVDSWVKGGATWTTPFDERFDNSPTFAWGAEDCAQAEDPEKPEGWCFVDTENAPMAAQPEQVFVDGTPLQQVGSTGKVDATSFYFDRATGTIHLGVDPAGREIRVSDLQVAIVAATPVEIRGIGVRRYANSVPHQGTVAFHGEAAFDQLAVPYPKVTDVILQDNAVAGVYSARPRTRVLDTTVRYNGLLGGSAFKADGMSFIGLSATHNNAERFHLAPAAAGFKASQATGLIVRDGEFSDNLSHGLWIDEKVNDFQVVSNDVRRNALYGAIVEISQNGYVVNNVITDNPRMQLFIQDSSDVRAWNNTLVGGDWGPLVVLSQDRGYVKGGTTEIMQARDNSVHNNIVAGATRDTSGAWSPCKDTVACYYDSRNHVPSSGVVTAANGNAYHRVSATDPAGVLRWAPTAATAPTYPTLDAFRTASGQEANGWEVTGAVPVTDSGAATPALAAQASAAGGKGVPVDPSVAATTAESRWVLTGGAYVIGATRS